MITLYAFGRVYPGMAGEARDLRAQWALEETNLPYRVHALDYVAGEPRGPDYSKLSYFHQVPVIDDEGVVVGESGAVVLYIAEKAGKLIPADFAGRMLVTQWCFTALTTLERLTFEIQMIDGGMGGEGALERRAALIKEANRIALPGLERRLAEWEWIAGGEFTVADILLSTVLRQVRHADILGAYPQLQAYYTRAFARPAWQRALKLTADRQRTTIEEIG